MARRTTGHPSDGTTAFAEESGRTSQESSYGVFDSLFHLCVIFFLFFLRGNTPEDNPFCPEPMPLHDGGQRSRIGGHVGKCEETKGGASANVCTIRIETAGRPAWSLLTWRVGAGARGPC